MVNVDRVKRKLPSLLLDGATTDRRHWAKRRKIERKLGVLKKRKPEQYHTLETRLIRDLEALELACFEC